MLLQPYHLVVLDRRSQVDTGEQRASTCTRTGAAVAASGLRELVQAPRKRDA
jgi:hypothetical protein